MVTNRLVMETRDQTLEILILWVLVNLFGIEKHKGE